MNKSKKNRTKPPQGRPVSTSAILQPAVEDNSNLTALSSFSPSGNHFAFLSLAVDKHRLRVYDIVTEQSVAEHIVDSARVSAITWGTIDHSDRTATSNIGTPPSKKKRKQRNSLTNEEGVQVESQRIDVVILGLSDGTTLFFSPTHGRVLWTLSHSTSTAEVLSVAVIDNADNGSTIWTSSADGTVRLWNVQKNDVLGCWKNDDRIPYACMAARPTDQGSVEMLVAHHGIRLLSTTLDNTGIDTQKPAQLASFTGHASTIKDLKWDVSQIPSTRFLSLAEADRFLYIWEVSEGSSVEGKPATSIPLDSDARKFSLSISRKSSNTNERQTLLTLSASGKISLFPIPSELPLSTSSNHKIPTLLSRSNISSKNDSSRVIDVAFGEEGSVRVAQVVGGIRPVFDTVRYLDASGEFIKDVIIKDIEEGPIKETHLAARLRRYAESPSLAVSSGVELGQHEDMDELATREVDGDLDVDLAELSLGQRLTALSGADIKLSSDSEETPKEQRSSKKKTQDEVAVVPANSLTRTLIQALHSSDSRLLETCLAHSDQTLIRNTVRRLPPQLAVPLVTACVERLGRGARSGNMKGGGGGASSQRGSTLIIWIKTTLIVHSGHLMAIPDLVTRLSGLHATLTSRLTLQESLLSLSGRLDMVLSQIEMRSSAAPAPLAPRKGKTSSDKQGKEVLRYVEGESESEGASNEDQMEVEVESSNEEGSIEDVELGGDSDEEEETSEEDEEDDDDSEGPTMNGFIDDEAEEYSEEEDDESE